MKSNGDVCRTEDNMEQDERLAKAMETLKNYIYALSDSAQMEEGYREKLWDGICQSEGLLQELAYYHDYGKFLCRYKVAGYTLADVLVWQVDHFKLYMDRPQEMNRYRQERLLLEAFETMLEMERNPAPFIYKMEVETGQDIPG